MVYVPRDDHGRLLRVEYQPFVGITDNQYTDLPEAARNKLDEQALAAGEHNRAMEIAHRFKSVAATIGAEHLCELTQHFEEQLREQRPYATCLTSLTLELNALLLQLDDESAGES